MSDLRIKDCQFVHEDLINWGSNGESLSISREGRKEETRQKSAVVTIARQESTYIQEWIAYQYLMGFDKIIVMLHAYQNEPDETFDKIERLPNFVLDRVVVGTISCENIDGINTPMYQRMGMYKAFDSYIKGKFEWMAMFDADEYLYDSQKRCVNDILDVLPEDAGQVSMPWLVYGPSNRVQSARYPETRLSVFNCRQPLERFFGYKSIVRVENIIDNGAWYWCHFAKTSGTYITFNGDVISNVPVENWDYIQNGIQRYPINYDTCLVHYHTGAMEDWVNRHKRRPITVAETEHDVRRFMNHSFVDFDDRMMVHHDQLNGILRDAKRYG